jgi:DNA-binding transcriptional ArsR family regulator
MTNSDTNRLRGRTLKVYLYVVKEQEPVGPRDVMRGVNLSSPSVAYRHLQKLETMGLITKNQYGNYIIKEKTSIRGYVWIGRNLVPNSIVYSLIFLFILIWEFIVLTIHFSVETEQFKIFFFLLMAITLAATMLFAFEGIRLLRKIKLNTQED